MLKISTKQIKQIIALKKKQNREKKLLFIAEGEKIVSELLTSKYYITTIVAVDEWIHNNHEQINKSIELLKSNSEELARISSMKTPNKVLAVVKMPEPDFKINDINNQLSIVLDNIQDPGNLGTIIRIADWFGIEHVICSKNSAELYNPKVLQATMGAFLRVKVIYTELTDFFKEVKKNCRLPVYGTFLKGKNIYTETLSIPGIIVMGNESKGISPGLVGFIDEKITIPSFNSKIYKTESLNVSMATAIICSEFKKNNLV